MSGHTDERDEAIRAFCLEGRLLVDDVRPLILGLLAERDELRAACLANSEKLGQEGSRMSALIVEAADRAEVAECRVSELEAALREAKHHADAMIAGDTNVMARSLEIANLARAAEPALTEGVSDVSKSDLGREPAQVGTLSVSAAVPAPTGYDERYPNHVAGCICPRFKDITPNLIADLTCPIHGVNGTNPGDILAASSGTEET